MLNLIQNKNITYDSIVCIDWNNDGCSGKCGSNAAWTLTGSDSAYILTIEGTGNMEDYISEKYIPWNPRSGSIQTIIIKNGITHIGDFAFFQCLNGSITIPETVTSIGDYAFKCCDILDNVTIPGNVVSIGNYAFSSCLNLRCVKIGNGVKKIGEYTFGNTKLSKIFIPKSMSSIGKGAIGNSTYVVSIWYGGSEDDWISMVDGKEIKWYTLHFGATEENFSCP